MNLKLSNESKMISLLSTMGAFEAPIFVPKRRKQTSDSLYDLYISLSRSTVTFPILIRVATAQGKQGIWLLTFPDRENTGNLVNLIFYTGKIVATRKILKI